MADSRLCKLSLPLIFVKLSWSTMITLSFLELAEEVPSPTQLHLKQDGLYAGQAGSLEDFFI